MSADVLNPLNLKEPDVRVVPDWRIHVALKTSIRQKRIKLELWRLNVCSTLAEPVRETGATDEQTVKINEMLA